MDIDVFSDSGRRMLTILMDPRFVAKRYIIIDGETRRRIIRMRMPLRGFKVLAAERLANHSATTFRLSQRLLIGGTTVQDDIVETSIDINKAFFARTHRPMMF